MRFGTFVVIVMGMAMIAIILGSLYIDYKNKLRNPVCSESFTIGQNVQLTDDFYKNCTGFITGKGEGYYSNWYHIRATCPNMAIVDVFLSCRNFDKKVEGTLRFLVPSENY